MLKLLNIHLQTVDEMRIFGWSSATTSLLLETWFTSKTPRITAIEIEGGKFPEQQNENAIRHQMESMAASWCVAAEATILMRLSKSGVAIASFIGVVMLNARTAKSVWKYSDANEELFNNQCVKCTRVIQNLIFKLVQSLFLLDFMCSSRKKEESQS